jgi:hypothetical protein
VVDHYNQGDVTNPFLDNQTIPLNLTESEKKDLVEMLRTLNVEGWQHAFPLLYHSRTDLLKGEGNPVGWEYLPPFWI